MHQSTCFDNIFDNIFKQQNIEKVFKLSLLFSLFWQSILFSVIDMRQPCILHELILWNMWIRWITRVRFLSETKCNNNNKCI